jgi:protein involved in ribonucleotide reduction
MYSSLTGNTTDFAEQRAFTTVEISCVCFAMCQSIYQSRPMANKRTIDVKK